jgi:hypothetical protein
LRKKQDLTPRGKALGALIVLGVIGAIVILALQSYTSRLKDLAVEQPELAARRAAGLFKGLVVLISTSLIAAGVYLIRLSIRIRRERQFRHMAAVMTIGGVLSIVASLYLAFVAFRLLATTSP